MAIRTTKAKISAVDAAIMDDSMVVADEKEKETVDENIKEKKVTKVNKINKEPLGDYEEIEVVSVVPNISYKDSKTGDMYEWDEVGHSEYMTVEVLKNMWRNHKGYFKDLLLKPMDDRIINQFGLRTTFGNYEFLMDKSSYTRNNIKEVCNCISKTPNGLKNAICNKIKSMIVDGSITDVSVIRTLEKQFGIDLISFL